MPAAPRHFDGALQSRDARAGYAAAMLTLLRNPAYCSSANTPVAMACATIMSSPPRFGDTAPESSSAMLPTVQAALPTMTSSSSGFGTDVRDASQPTSAV